MKKDIVTSVVFFSDPHFSVNSRKEEEKWFPSICNLLKKINPSGKLVKKFLDFWDKKTQLAFRKTIMKVKELKPPELMIGLGDYTPGSNESGMLTLKAQKQYLAFKKILSYVKCSKKLVWGDHDAGYRFNVKQRVGVKIGTEKGGMSEKSIKIAAKLIGEPFGIFYLAGVKFIFISTNLVRNVNAESAKELRELKFLQEDFLAKKLNNGNERCFLLLHDPTALGKENAVRKIIDSHREKIIAIIHGHMHAEFVRKISMISPVYSDLCKMYKTILVPASWGMMGIGGGFLTLNVYRDWTYEIKKHRL